MKILHADTDDLENPLRGGQPVRTWAINSRLAAEADITVFTSVYKGARRRQKRGQVQYERLGFRVPRVGLSPHLSFLAALGPKIARTTHDLVVEEFTPPIGYAMTPWWTQKPVISCVQWYFFEQWETRYRLPFSRWMESVSTKDYYRYFITQTRQMRSEILRHVPNAVVEHIPAGLDETDFQTPLTSETRQKRASSPYALFLGRLDRDHKGLDLLLDAWENLPNPVPLKIVGEGADRTWLTARLQASQRLQKSVKLLGRVEGVEKQTLLREAAFLVMPSRYETFGMVALEALAVGTPVICYDIANLNEVVDNDCAVLLPQFSTEALSAAVSALWGDPNRRDALARAAFERAQSYRWGELASQQKAFYARVLEHHCRLSLP